jgi:hypothetical protein
LVWLASAASSHQIFQFVMAADHPARRLANAAFANMRRNQGSIKSVVLHEHGIDFLKNAT